MEDLVQLARLGLSGRPQDIQQYVVRMSRRYRRELPELGEQLSGLVRAFPTRATPLRTDDTPVPVDSDSRLQLVRHELTPELESALIVRQSVGQQLEQIVRERSDPTVLIDAGLAPTRSVLFTGPPGVGKTMSARWLARELSLPLLTLDLSAVMSSFLGRTGGNVRLVLDYAKQSPSVLLLDELDAVAKRRDDATEVGELKRLVTVLLQELDDWPESSVLVAATNHSDLLDPAVWRRFDTVVDFPLPNEHELAMAIRQYGLLRDDLDSSALQTLVQCYQGASFSDVERDFLRARRQAALSGEGASWMWEQLVMERLDRLSHSERIEVAVELAQRPELSQRRVHELTGVSRDTIRKHAKEPAS